MKNKIIKVSVDAHKCRHCRRCVEVCPASVLGWTEERMPRLQHASQCIGCGHCMDVCESDALHHSLFPAGLEKRTFACFEWARVMTVLVAVAYGEARHPAHP